MFNFQTIKLLTADKRKNHQLTDDSSIYRNFLIILFVTTATH
ncbi:hypothetical protein LMG8520_2127 [Lactococcus lactis subsp. lactis]|uniref:Uncharacterized protein n=1 Tax=Lactococcus lactis subsp. lactis TaxID=1360 RepID=A0A0V8CYB8_LACLL|nr:hypothetical protein LMG8520_2127 [Lactococcus lactis subsp. lactis]